MFYYLVNEWWLVPSFLILGILIFVLPSLRTNRTYRSATIFAGLNAGVVTTVLLGGLLILGLNHENVQLIALYFTIPLPSLYISSLIIGATIIPKYVLPSPTYFRTALFALATLVIYFFLVLLVSRLIGLIILIATEGPLSLSSLLQMTAWLMEAVTNPHPIAIVVMMVVLGSTLVSLIATKAIMRPSRELSP